MDKVIIDLSVHNGEIDFHQLTGVEEVIIRATIGYGTRDTNLERNANGAAAAGHPIGYYHFGYPHSGVDVVEDATKQANYFVDTINLLPKFRHLCLDVEEFDDKGLPKSDEHLSPENFELWIRTFINIVNDRAATNCGVLYSYKEYLDTHLPSNHSLGSIPLWIAAYQKQEPGLPNGWKEWYIWQYDENGHLPGTNNDIDLSKRHP